MWSKSSKNRSITSSPKDNHWRQLQDKFNEKRSLNQTSKPPELAESEEKPAQNMLHISKLLCGVSLEFINSPMLIQLCVMKPNMDICIFKINIMDFWCVIRVKKKNHRLLLHVKLSLKHLSIV